MPDQQVEETPVFRETLVRLIRIHRPDIVVSSDPYRRYLWHRDHRIVGQVVMDALFPYARDHMAYPDMLAEGLEPHKVREALFFGTEDVNHHIDISESFDRKLAALECHKSQVRELKVGNLEGLAETALQAAGRRYAVSYGRSLSPGSDAGLTADEELL